jgi:hypothetical protein
MLRMKTGLLPPWKSPSLPEMQAIVNEVFGEGKHKVKEDNVWFGLVSVGFPLLCLTHHISEMVAWLHNWRCGFIDAAESSLSTLISDNHDEINSPKKIGDLARYYLSKTSDEETRVFQWDKVDLEAGLTKAR